MLLILDLFICCIFVHSGQVRNMATLKDSKSLCTLFGFSMEHLIIAAVGVLNVLFRLHFLFSNYLCISSMKALPVYYDL